MSYIPDCRTDENYNAEKLSNDDKQFVNGYDYCVEMAADSFFDNLDVFFGEDSHIMHALNEELPKYLKESYDIEFEYHGEQQKVTRDVETYADLIRVRMLDYIESQRDELIVSMIDNASDGATTDDEESYQ